MFYISPKKRKTKQKKVREKAFPTNKKAETDKSAVRLASS